MTQAHEMFTATVTALAGVAAGLGAVLALKLARGDRPGRAASAPAATGPVPSGFRYCPDEQRTRAAVLHGDGSANCSNCHTHIPATEEVPHA